MASASNRRSAPKRGQVLPFVAVAMIGVVGLMALLMDAGRGYLDRAELARAVDAAALAAARTFRLGEDVSEAQAKAVAAANRVIERLGVSIQVSFGVNELGENTISVRAIRPMNTLMARFLGTEVIQVAASAVAAVPPVDLVLVIDQSGSLATQGVWDDLQDAAVEFTRQFDDRLDRMGLVSFQLHAKQRSQLDAPFKGAVTGGIRSMRSAGDTNAGEGLRLALDQFQTVEARERSIKVVIFFTDGRPTAFRGTIGGEDRAIAVQTFQNGNVRGYFDDPDELPDNELAIADGCLNAASCFDWEEDEVRDQARQDGIDWADRIREEGIFLYTIGLGNPSAGDPLQTPDLGYLQLLANEGGATNDDQPAAKMYFAPSGAELTAVFEQVSQDLLIRLVR